MSSLSGAHDSFLPAVPLWWMWDESSLGDKVESLHTTNPRYVVILTTSRTGSVLNHGYPSPTQPGFPEGAKHHSPESRRSGRAPWVTGTERPDPERVAHDFASTPAPDVEPLQGSSRPAFGPRVRDQSIATLGCVVRPSRGRGVLMV